MTSTTTLEPSTQVETVLEHATIVETVTSDDPGESAHIVLIPPHLRETTTAQALVMEARVNGTPLTALCGYTWVPARNPVNLPLCTKCKDIFEFDPNGFDDRGKLPDA